MRKQGIPQYIMLNVFYLKKGLDNHYIRSFDHFESRKYKLKETDKLYKTFRIDIKDKAIDFAESVGENNSYLWDMMVEWYLGVINKELGIKDIGELLKIQNTYKFIANYSRKERTINLHLWSLEPEKLDLSTNIVWSYS